MKGLITTEIPLKVNVFDFKNLHPNELEANSVIWTKSKDKILFKKKVDGDFQESECLADKNNVRIHLTFLGVRKFSKVVSGLKKVAILGIEGEWGVDDTLSFYYGVEVGQYFTLVQSDRRNEYHLQHDYSVSFRKPTTATKYLLNKMADDVLNYLYE